MSDWDAPNVIIGQKRTARPTVAKGAALNIAQRQGSAIATAKDPAQRKGGPADYQQKAKLDADDAPKPPSTIDPAVGKAVAQARLEKKDANGKSMTQSELAKRINATPKDIADIEASRAKHDKASLALLAKMEPVLGIKLRGATALIGTPLHGPKKK
ncbi:hypothetical protein TREMEDRAFT_40093 [Tremella mesenterica DSM 1558]|uniref:uncharacterized protein n=1 Tax=Tremella mesenterica (strain ATCC 24925 / CBS 8224 / DSM 1558 / NBRC 9311 / NRRL Y-6157 / RJB 2259-6 / UBC 559-6) TaxID=578456 RepID=UPI0003F48E5A|nr:uncharacterized protein TREMEDRAFT_40093 [Tremella mesenterica DSM 1558]EIW67950.1 hypothetical protein TREMEDRAFT_40093 [Tremella mesenterica DSM 1558]